MKKITIIVTQLELGGAQMTALDMGEYFSALGHEVVFITNQQGVMNDRLIGNKNIKKYLLKDLRRKVDPLRDKKAYSQIKKILAKENPDIVHTHSSKAGILGRKAAAAVKIKYIFHTVHGFGFGFFKNPLMKKAALWAEQNAASHSTGLVFVSKDDMITASQLKIGRKDAYHLIRSGVDFAKFSDYTPTRDELRKKLGIPMRSRVIVNVAPFKKQKNLMVFVSMIKEIRDSIPGIKAYIVGDGVKRKALEKAVKAASLEKNVFLPGFSLTPEEYVKAADLYLTTSLWEGLPRTIIEAFLLGIPVVGSNIGGIKEVVKNEVNGFTFDLEFPQEGISHAVSILNNKKLRSKLSKGAMANIPEEFSKAHMLERLAEMYDALG
ncbi:glycosyltransferase [bacterium]|nr:glycosyltransferase [bacterium]